MNSPCVSVIIASYNCARYIGAAIDSVLAQTFTDHEIIVVDDGSTDNTRDVVAKYGVRVRYVYQDNRERAAARNTGIDIARGEYVAFLDADDVFLPHKLEQQVTALRNCPSADIVYSDTLLWNGHTAPVISTLESLRVHQPPEGILFEHLATRGFITLHSVLVRRHVLHHGMRFDESLPPVEDWDLWLRLAPHVRFIFLPKNVGYYRIHSHNSIFQQLKVWKSTLALREKLHHRPEFNTLSPSVQHRSTVQLGKLHVLVGNLSTGRRILRALGHRAGIKPILWWTASFLGQPLLQRIQIIRSRNNNWVRDSEPHRVQNSPQPQHRIQDDTVQPPMNA